MRGNVTATRRASRFRVFATAVTAVLAGCSGDDAPSRPDAAPDAPPPIPAVMVETPDPPRRPEVESCAAGFIAVDDGQGCVAPAVALSPCSFGEARFGDDPTCVAIGRTCGDGRFADVLPEGEPVRFVDPSAAAGGDGSREQPFQRIAEALVDAPPRLVLALAAGDHAEAVVVPAGVRMIGACAARTRLIGEAMATTGLVHTTSASVAIENLTIVPGRRPGISVQGAGASLRIYGVAIERPAVAGVLVFDGARVDANALVVTDAGAGIDSGHGVLVAAGSELNVASASILGSDAIGIAVSGGSRASISATWLAGNAGAIGIEEGSTATVVATAAIANVGFGIIVRDAELELVRSFVGGTVVDSGGEARAALIVSEGELHMEKVRLVDNGGTGITIIHGSHVSIADVVVRGAPMVPSNLQKGLLVAFGSTLDAERVAIEHYRYAGLLVSDEDTTATLDDVTVSDVVPDLDGQWGWGVVVQERARATMARIEVERVSQLGLGASDAGHIDATDLFVHHLSSLANPVQTAAAMLSGSGSELSVDRIRIEDVQGIGVMAERTGTRAVLSNVSIDRVGTLSCAETTCRTAGFGMGVSAVFSAALELSRFRIGGVSLCGVQVALDASLRLADGRIVSSPVGACVQVDDYDYALLTDAVVYEDNTVNLESTDLPVPKAEARLDSTFAL